MALSEHEQRLLEEMERNLYQNEADVVTALGVTKRAPNYTAVVAGVVMAVVGLGIMLWAVSASLTWLGVIGFLVLFAGVMVAVTIPGPVTEGAARSAGPGPRGPQLAGPRRRLRQVALAPGPGAR